MGLDLGEIRCQVGAGRKYVCVRVLTKETSRSVRIIPMSGFCRIPGTRQVVINNSDLYEYCVAGRLSGMLRRGIQRQYAEVYMSNT